MSKQYFVSVSLLTFIIPLTGFLYEHFSNDSHMNFGLFGKWFVFSAVGLRLLVAGIQQSTKPEFKAKEIFHIHSPESLPIVRELGFSNLCLGLIGIVSMFKPEWRIVCAFAGGLYFGIAGLQHLIKNQPVLMRIWRCGQIF